MPYRCHHAKAPAQGGKQGPEGQGQSRLQCLTEGLDPSPEIGRIVASEHHDRLTFNRIRRRAATPCWLEAQPRWELLNRLGSAAGSYMPITDWLLYGGR